MANFPGPHQVRMFYTVTIAGLARTHQQNLNCVIVGDDTPGNTFSGYQVDRRVSEPDPLDTVIDAYVELLKDIWANTCTINRAELWSYEEGTNNAAFMSTYDISEACEAAGNNLADGEVIQTYRTIGGGSMRVHFLECVHDPGLTDSPPFANAAHEAFRAFVVSPANWLYARDNSYPFSALGLYPGINERLFKDRYRQ